MDRTVFVLVLFALTYACGPPETENPEDRFRHGKWLIESNCGDCQGATRIGLEAGIAEVRKALELGYKDQAMAVETLADAYNTLTWVYATPGSDEQKQFRQQQKSLYEKLLKLRPRDAETAYLYAGTLSERDAQRAGYRRALQLDPNHAAARFALGTLLIERGDIDEGIAELKRAVTLADSGTAHTYARRIIPLLKHHGRAGDAAEIERLAASRQK